MLRALCCGGEAESLQSVCWASHGEGMFPTALGCAMLVVRGRA